MQAVHPPGPPSNSVATPPFRAALGLVALVAVIAGLAPVTDAGAQELYNYSLFVTGGLAGSFDADIGDGIDNPVLQVGFNYVTERRARLGFRLGRFDLDSEDRFEGLTDAELTYLTVAGEYRFVEPFYDSGLFLGLGAYQLDGRAVVPDVDDDEIALGVTLGVNGDFRINRRLSFVAELAGHYVDFEAANFFASGQVGIAFHFK